LRWRQSDEFCAALSELLRKMIAIPIAVGDATPGAAATSAPPPATPEAAVPHMLVRIFELATHVLLTPHQVLHALAFTGEAIEVWGARAEAALCTMAGDHEAQDAKPASRSVAAIGMLMGQVGMLSLAHLYLSLSMFPGARSARALSIVCMWRGARVTVCISFSTTPRVSSSALPILAKTPRTRRRRSSVRTWFVSNV
jgi:hypothetical protein